MEIVVQPPHFLMLLQKKRNKTNRIFLKNKVNIEFQLSLYSYYSPFLIFLKRQIEHFWKIKYKLNFNGGCIHYRPQTLVLLETKREQF